MSTEARVDILLNLKTKSEEVEKAISTLPRLTNELARTESSVRSKLGSISTEFDKLGKSIQSKFSVKGIGMSLLGGLGIGSGFAILNTAFGQITAAIEKHANAIKGIEDTWKRIYEVSQQYQRSLLSPEAQISAMEQDLAKLQGEYLKLAKIKEYAFSSFNPSTGQGETVVLNRPDDSTQNIQAMASNLEAQQSLAIKIAEARKKQAAETAKATDGENKIALAQSAQANKDELAARKAIADAIAKQDAEMAALTDKYREIADPSLQFTKQMEQVNMLLRGGHLLATEAAAAIDDLTRQMQEAERGRVDKALTDFFGPIDSASENNFKKLTAEAKAFNQELAGLWNNVSDRAGQAFAEILIDGTNSFRSLAREITKSVVEIAARMAIINPILNAVFGSFGGFQKLPTFGTAKAAGGGSFVTSGPTNFTVGDNPGGVELVSVLPLSGVGRSSINGRNLAMAGGGSALVGGAMGGGDTFNFSYSFQGGVSRAEVLGLIPSIVEASKGAVLEAKKRKRGGF